MRISDWSSDVFSSDLNRHGSPERSPRRGERDGAAKAFGVWRQNDNLQVPHAGHPGSLGSLSVRNRKDIKSTISSLPALSSPKGTSERIVSSAARLPRTPMSAPITPCSAQLKPGRSGSLQTRQRTEEHTYELQS